MSNVDPQLPTNSHRSSLLGHEWKFGSWDDGPIWHLVRVGTLVSTPVGEFQLTKDGTYAWNANIMKGVADSRDQAVGAVELSVELRERLRTMEGLPGLGDPDFDGKMAARVEAIKGLVVETLRKMHEGAGAMFDPVDWEVRVELTDKPGYVNIHLDQKRDDGEIDLDQLARTRLALEGL